MPNLTSTRDAKQRLKEIRPYVNFNYDLRKPLTKYQKRKIGIYYKELQALFSRPYQIYRPRGRKADREIQSFAQHEHYLPGLKVAVIPNNGELLKIRRRGKKITAKGKYVNFHHIALDVEELLNDPEAHVNEQIKKTPAKQYTIQAGRYEIPIPYLPTGIAKAVARLTAKYADESDNHFFGRWLHGLTGYTFDNQKGINEYLQTKHAAIKEGKARRLTIRRLKEKIDNLKFRLRAIENEKLISKETKDRLRQRIAKLEKKLELLYKGKTE